MCYKSFLAQVTIGPGISISKEKWKFIKGQKKNSLFIKKLATSVYGSEGLKVRTVGKSKTDSSKQMATPVKVDTFVGMFVSILVLILLIILQTGSPFVRVCFHELILSS